MPVPPAQLSHLTLDEVPKDMRHWVEAALTVPLNRLIDDFRALLTHGVSLETHVNAQVVERTFIAPDPTGSDWTSHHFDTLLNISGPVLGVQVLGAWTVDAAGHDSAPVGSLPSPIWQEVAVGGRKALRLVFQSGLTEGLTYRLLLLAWGE